MSLARTIILAVCACIAVPSAVSEAAPSAVELAKSRAAAAERAFRSIAAGHRAGRTTAEAVYTWSVRLAAVVGMARKRGTARQAPLAHAVHLGGNALVERLVRGM